jgi:hypothetical protein
LVRRSTRAWRAGSVRITAFIEAVRVVITVPAFAGGVLDGFLAMGAC